MAFFRKLLLLMWKNWVLRKRHWFISTLETFVPFIVLFAFWGLFQLAVSETRKTTCSGKNSGRSVHDSYPRGKTIGRGGTDTMLSPIYEKDLNISCGSSSPCLVAYSPKNADTDQVIKMFSADVSHSEIAWKGFASEREIEEMVEDKGDKKRKPLRAAIIFENNFSLAAKSISYKIRMATFYVDDVIREEVFHEPIRGNYDFESYEKSGFLAFQFHLDKVLINLMTNKLNPDLFKGFSLQGIKHRQGKDGQSGVKCGRSFVGTHKEIKKKPKTPEEKSLETAARLRRIIIPILVSIGLIFIVPTAMMGVVNEKTSGMKEFMKLCGLPNWMIWFTWTLNTTIFLTIPITMMVILLFNSLPACDAVKNSPLIIYTFYEFSTSTIVWILLMLYVTALALFCFFLSTFFNNAVIAIIAGFIIWIVTYFGPMAVFKEKFYNPLGTFQKMGFCLIPNVALYMALQIIGLYETEKANSCYPDKYSYTLQDSRGVKWSKLFEPLNKEDDLSMGLVMIMLMVDIVVYIFLTLYFEAVLPSKHGVQKPFYFLLLPSTYGLNSGGGAKVAPKRNEEEYDEMGNLLPSKFQDEPIGLKPGVEIINLRKSFGFLNRHVAVDGISMKMFQGEIFALLGHNGAGKTTTISCCIGEKSITGGTILINGSNIQKQLSQVQRQLGFCPQHNVLFDELTVDEHLYFFGMLKGINSRAAKSERVDLIEKLRLTEKTRKNSKSLSGGQKRRLCLGNALIGNAKVVFLDEPTSGMDVETRRTIWDILLAVRSENERTIILTTHFMEEADALGDRIGIMARGKLVCYGTTKFLKDAYGAGYTLTLSIANDAYKKKILKRVRKRIPDAFEKDDVLIKSGQLVITLPTNSFDTSELPKFFSKLEKKQKSYGIKTIGLSLTTMDDVFVKASDPKQFMTSNNTGQVAMPLITADSTKTSIISGLSVASVNEDPIPDTKHFKVTEATAEEAGAIAEVEINTDENRLPIVRPTKPVKNGPALIWKQFCGIFIKRFLYTVKTRSLIFTQLVIPILMLCLAIYASEAAYLPQLEFQKSAIESLRGDFRIGLDTYEKPETLYSATDPAMEKLFASAAGRSAKLYSSTGGNTLEKQLLSEGDADNEKHVVAAEINSTHFIFMFSTSAEHSPAIALNLASNTFLRKLDTSLKLSVANQPLRQSPEKSGDRMQQYIENISIFADLSALVFAMLSSIAFALMAASFVSALLEERVCNGKQLQLMTGINPLVYWGATFAFDLCVLLIVITGMLISFFVFQYKHFTVYARLDVYIAIILAYGFAVIPMSYLCSLFAKSVAGAFSLLAITHIVTGVILPILVILCELIIIVMTLMAGLSTKTSFGFIHLIRIFSRIFPTFGAANSIHIFLYFTHLKARDDQRKAFGRKTKWIYDFNEISWTVVTSTNAKSGPPGIGQEMFFMILYGMLYHGVLILYECGYLQSFCQVICSKNKTAFGLNNNDEDVMMETQRVDTLVAERKTAEDALVVSHLCKGFGSFAAVSNLTFGVHHGECFGMLGVNGAGKTTAFRMLTGDLNRSSGDAYMMNNSLGGKKRDFISQVGYCPQFDGIIEVLTGRQMLVLFARLRGLTNPKAEADLWIRKVGLQESADSQCGKYSGGMKRRLSAAMAMIGDSKLILLDEPTSGVDPVSRREFWKVIQSINDSGRAIILTSHSMDEVTACCQRLGIMVNGMLQCFGDVTHLKDKFAQGFTLAIRFKSGVILESPEMEALDSAIMKMFTPCSLKDKHQTGVEYHINNLTYPYSVLFKTMEDIKPIFEELIEDYSFAETTLEEVFISFARMQYGARETKVGCCRRCLPS